MENMFFHGVGLLPAFFTMGHHTPPIRSFEPSEEYLTYWKADDHMYSSISYQT